MPYLIDGHNVIAAMEGIDLDDPNDEAKLVMKLRAWTAHINRKAILVFDGGIPGGPSRTLSTPAVKVIFAARHHTIADRIIRERIRELPDASNWTVISSDREILDEAAAAGARTLTAQEFADAIEHPPNTQKEKPDTISAAEIEAWLQVFQEPESTTPPPISPDAWAAVASTQPDPPAKPSPKTKQPPPQRQTPTRRHKVSIGAQMGLDVQAPPENKTPGGKPEHISEQEVEAWLQVFHDDPDSEIPPPNLPKPKPKPRRRSKRQEAVVRKDGNLSSEEVESWLTVFSEKGSSSSPKSNAADPTEPPRSPPSTGAGASAKLVEHREKLAPAEGQGKADLSDEDQKLWERLFGEEP